jgi:hypothetical protein
MWVPHGPLLLHTAVARGCPQLDGPQLAGPTVEPRATALPLSPGVLVEGLAMGLDSSGGALTFTLAPGTADAHCAVSRCGPWEARLATAARAGFASCGVFATAAATPGPAGAPKPAAKLRMPSL